jgi:uncharacterized membrane protein
LVSATTAQDEPKVATGKNWSWLFYSVCAVILAVGLYIRCSTLSVPIIWHDECASISHAAGSSSAAALNYWSDKEVTFGSIKEKFLVAKKDTDLVTIWKVLEHDDPHHAPLFPILLNLWERFVSNNLEQIRWATVVISFFQIPAMFWLGREISGGSNRVGALATALLAVLPANLWYAQEIREYSLTVVLILASSAAIIRAVRTSKLHDWLIYGVLLSIGFYASSFTLFSMISHVLYVMILQRPKVGKTYFAFSKRFLLFVGMLVVTLLICLPRFAVQISHSGQTMSMQEWMFAKRPLAEIFNQAMFNTFISQFDLYKDITTGYINIAGLLIIMIVCCVVIARSAHRNALFFLGSWAGVCILVFWVPDFLFSGWRTTLIRYWLPIPLSLTVTYALGLTLMLEKQRHVMLRVAAPILLAFVVLCDVFSCAHMTTLPEKIFMDPMSLAKIKRVINWDHPKLIVTSQAQNNFVNTMQVEALSTILEPDLRLLWLTGDKDVPIKDDYFLLLNPNDKVKKMVLDQGYVLEPTVEVRETLTYLLSAKRKSAADSEAKSE